MEEAKVARGCGRWWQACPVVKSDGGEISVKRGGCRFKQKRQEHSGVAQGGWGDSSLWPEGKQQESVVPGEERGASVKVAPLTERKVRSRTAKAMGRRLSDRMSQKYTKA